MFLEVKASFDTFTFLTSHSRIKTNFTNTIVAFYGVADKFCLWGGNQVMNCRRESGNPFKELEQNPYDNFDTFITAKLMTPIYFSFYMWIEFDLLSDEWLEIVIWNRELEDKKRSSLKFHYLTEVVLLEDGNSLEKVGPLPEHILMLELHRKLTSLNLTVGVDIRTDLLSTDITAYLYWESKIDAWRLGDNTFISLHGKIHRVQFKVEYAGDYNKTSNLSMKAVWIHNVFDPYLKDSQTPSRPCIEIFSIGLIYDKCLNLSVVKSNNYTHYVLFTKILKRKRSFYLKSWEKCLTDMQRNWWIFALFHKQRRTRGINFPTKTFTGYSTC